MSITLARLLRYSRASDCNSGIPEFRKFRFFAGPEIPEFLLEKFRNFGTCKKPEYPEFFKQKFQKFIRPFYSKMTWAHGMAHWHLTISQIAILLNKFQLQLTSYNKLLLVSCYRQLRYQTSRQPSKRYLFYYYSIKCLTVLWLLNNLT